MHELLQSYEDYYNFHGSFFVFARQGYRVTREASVTGLPQTVVKAKCLRKSTKRGGLVFFQDTRTFKMWRDVV